jgi:hypothetical protein
MADAAFSPQQRRQHELLHRRSRQLKATHVAARRGLQTGALLALTAAVLFTHLLLADVALPDRLGAGAANAADMRPPPIAVSFVRQLAQAAPPAAAPARLSAGRPAQPATRSLPRVVAEAPEQAASAPDAGAPAEPLQAAALPVPEAAAPLPELAALAASPSAVATEAAAAAAASAPASSANFEWPPSTRISYRLNGNYRGPVEGQAQVEWLRSGSRYQVRMDLSIGPSFAPLMSRRVSSDGEITDLGLRPRRYDEETKVVLRDPRRLTIHMDGERVQLPGGAERPRPAQLQDSASQFVQLTWLFTMQPELLQAGRSIEVPLALPRVVEVWTYDVVGSETLATLAGPVLAWHVKPRREPKPGSDLTAEIWVAPSLQYLPVRILIRQDADTWIDLSISKLPEQAAPGK